MGDIPVLPVPVTGQALLSDCGTQAIKVESTVIVVTALNMSAKARIPRLKSCAI